MKTYLLCKSVYHLQECKHTLFKEAGTELVCIKINLLILKSTEWTLRPAMYTNQTHISVTDTVETLLLMPAA